MDWITDKIAIGNFVDATNCDLLKEHAFRSILCLDCTIPPPKLEGIKRHVVHLTDEPCNQLENFMRAVTTLEQLVQTSSPVFLHCYAGRSRSVIVLAAYFMRSTGCSPQDAIAKVAAKRLISITTGVEQLLHHI
ncbi:MAG TPA: dual specificity protein phosphatase [Verrucomicrobiae bacterium]|jgi:protein-tyrosine phosphatase